MSRFLSQIRSFRQHFTINLLKVLLENKELINLHHPLSFIHLSCALREHQSHVMFTALGSGSNRRRDVRSIKSVLRELDRLQLLVDHVVQNQLSGQVEGKFVAEILHRKVEATNRHTRIVSIVKALAAHDSVLKVLTALTVC